MSLSEMLRQAQASNHPERNEARRQQILRIWQEETGVGVFDLYPFINDVLPQYMALFDVYGDEQTDDEILAMVRKGLHDRGEAVAYRQRMAAKTTTTTAPTPAAPSKATLAGLAGLLALLFA